MQHPVSAGEPGPLRDEDPTGRGPLRSNPALLSPASRGFSGSCLPPIGRPSAPSANGRPPLPSVGSVPRRPFVADGGGALVRAGRCAGSQGTPRRRAFRALTPTRGREPWWSGLMLLSRFWVVPCFGAAPSVAFSWLCLSFRPPS